MKFSLIVCSENNGREVPSDEGFPLRTSLSRLFTAIVVTSRGCAREEKKSLQLELPHHGNEKLLDLLDGASELQGGTILSVVHGEQHMQFICQVFPIRLAPILLLLVNQHTAAIIIRT